MADDQSKWSSCQNLPDTIAKPCQMVHATVNRTTDYLNRGAALCDQVASKLNDVISLMDEETFTGTEQDLCLACSPALAGTGLYGSPPAGVPYGSMSHDNISRTKGLANQNADSRSPLDYSNRIAKANALASPNVFEKASMYANSRLPADLPPLRVYIPTWPIICLAARYSLNAYRRPLGAETDAYVNADWRVGTKAMVIKSVPIDDMNALVFAIRGTQTFMDWAVNLNTATVSPSNFLDDAGNLCHAGFLDVARKMVKPVAARLRQLLEENPSRSSCSLVITGHSAGGAVASLLYRHMLSETVESELSTLTNFFKRVHCITFGAPPVSLLPLSKPAGQERRMRKNVFLSFINEGDPVTRAGKAYVRSLLELYASPAPTPAHARAQHPNFNGYHGRKSPSPKTGVPSSWWNNNNNNNNNKTDSSYRRLGFQRRRHGRATTTNPAAAVIQPYSNSVWRVPSAILSNAGRLVVLRTMTSSTTTAAAMSAKDSQDNVQAFITTDDDLRKVVYGDPMMHQMRLYFQRIEALATKAATGRV